MLPDESPVNVVLEIPNKTFRRHIWCSIGPSLERVVEYNSGNEFGSDLFTGDADKNPILDRLTQEQIDIIANFDTCDMRLVIEPGGTLRLEVDNEDE